MSTTVSSTPDAAPHERGAQRGRPGRRAVGMVLAVLAVIVGAIWWWLSIPRLDHGSSWGASSNDHDILEIRSLTGPDMTVLPADHEGTATVMLTLRNGGRAPVTLLDVWPEKDELGCGWGPTERRVRIDPRLMYADDGATAPLPGVSITPGTEVAVYLEGTMNDPAGCEHTALSSVATIPVEVRVLGRASTVEIDLQQHLGWTDDLDAYADQDLTVRRPPND